MDDSLEIVPLEKHYADQIQTWANQSASKALLKQSGLNTNPEGVTSGWVTLRNQTPIAVATIHVDIQHIGYLEFMVKPSEQRQGVGAQLVEYVLQQPVVKTLSKLRVLVEHDNIAAQKILAQKDFSRIGYSAEGNLEFEKR